MRFAVELDAACEKIAEGRELGRMLRVQIAHASLKVRGNQVFTPQREGGGHFVQFAPFEQTFPKLAAYLSDQFAEVGNVKSGDAEWKFLRRRSAAAPRDAA